MIIKNGIIISNDWSFCIKILSIAGSSSQAIYEVLAATKREKNTAITIFLIYFFVYSLKSLFNVADFSIIRLFLSRYSLKLKDQKNCYF